ncbi:MAG TPA: hypothetical protein VH109_13990 [Steroidobacteraceae bacterium]|jgi:hypothetical protein|nr:hypothetical protein [Steroidobacteraceae bacterium]
MKKQFVWLVAALMAVLLVGCANDKAPAEQAIAGAEQALAATRDAAQKYAPDALQAVDSQLAQVKDMFAKGDYKSVMANIPALNTAIGSLKDTASAKMAEAQQAMAKAKDDWGSVSTDVPKMVAAIQSRVDVLSKSHSLPKGVTKDALASAKSGLDSMKSAWSDAMSAASGGDYSTAMSKAQAVKDQGSQIMQSLGMSSG